MINILETAQGSELKTLIESCKEILEREFSKNLTALGIQDSMDSLTQLDELVNYSILSVDSEKEAFKTLQNEVWNAIKVEVEATGEAWQEAHFWFVDRMVYTFLNRLFAIRVMESLELLNESTLCPQADLGNRSARMARIQELYPGKTMFKWWQFVLRDAFGEIGKDVRILFDETDVASRIWPDGQVIEQLVQQLNAINPEIYKAPDIIGWFYHYYVLKVRKGHKTMSSHGSKSPANPNYLSILNTVYTPRWMVRVLVDNSLGHWWQDTHPDSRIFLDSPFFIKKVPAKLEPPTEEITNLHILDPACGSGNFLVYTFDKLVEMYKETFSGWSYSEIVEKILGNNLFGIDINRRPAQLSALALYISAKNVIRTKAPTELGTFKMPVMNIICCAIRIPHDKNRVLFIQHFKDTRIQKIMKDVVEQFDNADQLGSLIDIQGLQTEVNMINDEKRVESQKHIKLDRFLPSGKKMTLKSDKELDLVSFIESEVLAGQQSNVGMQIFGRQARTAASLAQVLMHKYDIILGNPPFGFLLDGTKQKIRKIYPNSYSDLISAFIDQSLRLLKEKGYIAMVSDSSFMHSPKFEYFRREILLSQTYIQYMFLVGEGALPNAANRPNLFLIRKSKEHKNPGYYRYVNVRFFKDAPDPKKAINEINNWNETNSIPTGWNLIYQNDFFKLPRCVIEITLVEKFKSLLEFFKMYPRLDFAQLEDLERENIPKDIIARCYRSIDNGNNDRFIKYWFELKTDKIRLAEPIEELDKIDGFEEKPFVPISKGGGSLQYYLNNGYIFWWNKKSIEFMKNEKGSALRSIKLIGLSDIIFPIAAVKPVGRYCISQKGIIFTVVNGIKILNQKLDKFVLIAYLNSKISFFFAQLQTRSRVWAAGVIARFPIPLSYLIENENTIKSLAIESFELRRDWDTGYPMSPIFSETLIDKVIEPNSTIINPGIPNTGHPFCNEYKLCKSNVAIKIQKIKVNAVNATIFSLLDAIEKRFLLLVNRLNECDEEINRNLFEKLLDKETQIALDEYYDTYVGKRSWFPEKDIWLKDFLMSGLMDIIKVSPKGIVPLETFKEGEPGVYKLFIDLLCSKFGRDLHFIQPILKEMEHYLGKELRKWIEEDFFFYHCQRFGGRPIIWQFSTRSKSGKENALDLFIDYHKITENTLPNIRVEYIEPLIRSYEQRKGIGMLPKEDVPRIDELEEFSKAFIALEIGYQTIPNPNTLTGNKSQKGKGDDKTWEWVLGEAAKIIRNGYKPDHFLGVLVNILPLCFDLPESRQKDILIKYQAICPKGTLKQVLKKLDTLDQLRNVGSKEVGEEEDANEADQSEGKKKRRTIGAANEDSESNEEEANGEESSGEDS